MGFGYQGVRVPPRVDWRYKWYLTLCGLGFLAITTEIVRVYLRHDLFGIWDFPLIFNYAESFLEKGVLYSSDPTLYKPSVPTGYPHPPLSPSLLIWAIRAGFSRWEIFTFLSFGHVLCYVLSIICCWFGGKARHSWGGFFFVFFAAFCMAQLMEYNLMMLLLDPLLLFIFCLSLFFLSKNNEFISGFFMGIGAMLKIYPAVFGIYFLATKRWSAIAGMVCASVLCLALSVAVIGLHENWIYFTVGLPQQLKEYPYLFFYENVSISSYMLYFNVLSPAHAKIFGSAVFFVLLFLSIVPSFRQVSLLKEKNIIVALDYACLTSLLILCMPNSWWNYQIHLLLSAVVVAIFIAKQDRPHYGIILVWGYSLLSLAMTAALAADHTDIDYFVQMDSSMRMTYIVLRGVPTLLLFALPFVIRWGIFLGKYSIDRDVKWQPALQLIS